MKDIDIIRKCLPATERLLEGTEVDLYEFDAVRLEQAAKLIRERLEAENIAALETMEGELADHMERFGI